VVTEHEVVGYFTDRRTSAITVTLDRQQELVLGGGQSGLLRPLLAPPHEPAQAGPELQELLEVSLSQPHIVPRYRIRTMEIGAEAGGTVMATGIVSVAIHYEGFETISRVLLAICAVIWVILAALLALVVVLDFRHAREEAKRPAALTAVAGTAVLGARLALLGWSWAGWTLLVIAAVLPALLLPVLARAGPLPRTGGSFLTVVAVQSLAVLAATLAGSTGHTWPALVALAPCVVGVAAYPAVLARFDLSELRHGAGDHWVSGGALAISTLSCAQIANALVLTRGSSDLHDALRVASLVLWGLTMAWLPVLIVAEARWPRPSYDVRRWATVFPLGMYSVMSTTTGGVAGMNGLTQFGHAAAWVALAAWFATALGWGRRRLPLDSDEPRGGRSPRPRSAERAVRGPTTRCRT
jgi:tellurite resistance protein TehA-like permease